MSVRIEVSAETVYEYVIDPRNLPQWAAGLADSSLTQHGDTWTTNSPMGEVSVQFVPRNEFGIFDHVVTLPSGESVFNPVRVVPDGEYACDVVFTVRQREMTDEQFELDTAAVQKDLNTLKRILEG